MKLYGLAIGLALAGAALMPARAGAFAWSDTCAFTIFNNTSSSSVRPTYYLPIPPNAQSLILYATLAATGVPQGAPQVLTNTGYPFSDGCTASLAFSNPGSNVGCGAWDPTTGDSGLTCNGNSSVVITEDDDDIRGNVVIPAGSGARDAFDTALTVRAATVGAGAPKLPPRSPGPVRRNDLPAGRWRALAKLDDLGFVGRLWQEGSLPAFCRREKKSSHARATRGGASAFARPGGREAIGALAGVYADGRQAAGTLRDIVSAKSIGCLRLLLSSSRLRTTVAVKHPPAARMTAGARLIRLVIRRSSPKQVYYLDLAAVQRGNANALVMFMRARSPFSRSAETRIVRKALSRI